ncbi:MAG: endonuclease domain-containing protein [Thermodesulfovibrionales bacterium]|nr:endonuclease domain-containing protein [Thermodesulfovibrionales bacterium]
MKKKKILPYKAGLKERARELRKNSALSEVLLWRYLKGKQLLGYDFDRQRPVDNFIVDFFCNELMLAIEIDGDTHNYRISQDIERQRRIEGLGVRFLRFTDEDVKQNIEGVVTVIEKWIRENNRIQDNPPLNPLPRGDLYD